MGLGANTSHSVVIGVDCEKGLCVILVSIKSVVCIFKEMCSLHCLYSSFLLFQMTLRFSMLRLDCSSSRLRNLLIDF